MAKVEVQDRAFQEPLLKLASAKFKVSRAVILGYALIVWRESQQLGVVEASRDEILAWLDTDRFAKPERAIKWLQAADYLRPIENERFLIAGNELAVERTRLARAASQRGVRARLEKKARNLGLTNRSTDGSTDRQPDGQRVGSPDIKTYRHTAKISAAPKTAGGSEVWKAYALAFRNRYGVDPVRNAKANALCTQLVKRLGEGPAMQVVQFYLTHGKSWYVEKQHDLGLCVADCEALHTQMLRGVTTTRTSASHADKNAANAAAFAEVARRWEQRDKEGTGNGNQG